ncbi:arsenate reductase [Reinekea blandensis]|uniref:Arsenate reductase n=1 Tax=Reinekea blandensis MED297 TaxID=314283 RepID=A4BCF3_9GAMM|nr:arsenate reductase [Reinekea blandensis]EAR10219.1 arsenate reductase [Reinekea sp. MED297] [Reinekea blandensis MED297]
MLKIYGIRNCDTLKKTLAWFKAHDTEVEFIDYKKQPPDHALASTFVSALGWEQVINKRGTTWRKLDDAIKASINEQSAIQLMLEQPSIIKRPIIQQDDNFWVGYDESLFQSLI